MRIGDLDKSEPEMVSYLLGKLSENDEMLFEERYFADDELFERMLTVKEELIDAYVRGRFDESEREQFERGFLNSPHRQEEVAFAQALKEKLSEATPKTSAQEPDRMWWKASFIFGAPRVWPLTAAVLLMFIALLWGWRKNLNLREELRALQVERDHQAQRESELQRQLAQLREHALSTPTPHPVPTVLPTPPRPKDVSPAGTDLQPDLLLSFASRSLKEVGTLNLIPDQKVFSVRIVLDEKPRYRGYTLVLRTVDGRDLERRSGLRAVYRNEVYSITTGFSAGSLAADEDGEYIMAISGVAAQGKEEGVESFKFRVNRK